MKNPLPLTVSAEADADMDIAASYIAADNVDAALRFLVVVRETFEFLQDNPGAGRLRDSTDARLKDVRQWAVRNFSNYLIFYVELPDSLKVLRLLHGARDIDSVLQNEPS